MRNTDYVRGTLKPTTDEVNAWTSTNLSEALGRAGIKSLRSNSLQEEDRIMSGIVDFHNSHPSAGPGFAQDFLNRLQGFLKNPKTALLGLEGEILVISDTQTEFPEIYNIIVRNGQATIKTGLVSWK